MTLWYVDTEHDRVRGDDELGPAHRAKVEAKRGLIEATADERCLAVPFAEVSPDRVRQAAPRALVIGGNTTDWACFDDAALDGLLATIRAAPVPILGICAGHQLIGFAHGAPWAPLGPLRDGEPDPDPRFAPGQRKERGFLPVEVDRRCPLFRHLAPTATFFQSHYWQLAAVPAGFVARARSPWSPIQAIERLNRPVFGVQFHPERHDTAHSDGAAVLRSFFALLDAEGKDARPPTVTGRIEDEREESG